MDDDTLTCDLCKVGYSTQEELEDHQWSLIHHIKIEKSNKGAPHSCILCMATLPNIIEYGKHLNEDQHKHALSRRSKQGPDELLDSFATQADTFGRENLDGTALEVEMPNIRGHTRGHGHSRSFSQPEPQSRSNPFGNFLMSTPVIDADNEQGRWQSWNQLKHGHGFQRNQKSIFPGNDDGQGLLRTPGSLGNNDGQGLLRTPSYHENNNSQRQNFLGNQEYQGNGGDQGQFLRPQGFQGNGENQGQFVRNQGHQFNTRDERSGRQNPHFDNNAGFGNDNADSFRDRQFYQNDYSGINWNDNNFQNLSEGHEAYQPDRSFSGNTRDSYGRNGQNDVSFGSNSRDNYGRNGQNDAYLGNNRDTYGRKGQDDASFSSNNRDTYGRNGQNERLDNGNNWQHVDNYKDHHWKDKGRQNNQYGEGRDGRDSGYRNEGRRGRGRFRDRQQDFSHQERNRSASDMYSPESNSSSDSNGRKRRIDIDSLDRSNPGKSRRGNQDSRIYQDTDAAFSTSQAQYEYQRGRTSSLDRGRTSNLDRLSMSVPVQMNEKAARRTVTWSDQQDVSSTTDTKHERPGRSRSLENINRNRQDVVLPDSSTSSKKAGKKKGKNNGSPRDGTSDLKKRKQQEDGESVLDRAEKLCRKLRKDREKLKQQRQISEKQKKLEKAEELNSQIEELSKKNKQNIKGHLDSMDSLTSLSGKVSDSGYTSNDSRQTNDVNKSVTVSEPRSPTKKPILKIGNVSGRAKPNIDSIRAKIEGSVLSDSLSPMAKSSPAGSSRKLDNASLLKMVNSPRSTKERLKLAQMLRDHAKSQKKLSLPRFNLRMSDLCTGSDRHNDLADIDLEALAPSIQLEIANLIEADVKPDVTELEKLLDIASAQNVELDANILSNLGIFESPEKLRPGVRAPSPLVSNRAASPSIGAASGRHTPTVATGIDSASIVTGLEKNLVKDMTGQRSTQRARSPVRDIRERAQSPLLARKDGTSYSGSNTERVRSPVRRKDIAVDYGLEQSPSLSIDDLVSEVNKANDKEYRDRSRSPLLSCLLSEVEKAKEHLKDVREWDKENQCAAQNFLKPMSSEGRVPSPSPISLTSDVNQPRLGSRKDVDKDNQGRTPYDGTTVPGRPASTTPAPNTDWNSVDMLRVVKQEKLDRGYDIAEQGQTRAGMDDDIYGAGAETSRTGSEREVYDSASGRFSPVRKSIHTRNLHVDTLPVRDTGRHRTIAGQDDTRPGQDDGRSALEKVTAILDGVPNMEKVLTKESNSSKGDNTTGTAKGDHATNTAKESNSGLSSAMVRQDAGNHMGGSEPGAPDAQLDLSLGSQSSSVLDQVYQISVQEEQVRNQISTMDSKISQLQRLIDEASQQLSSCTEKKESLLKEESEFRMSRMKILQDSRSAQGSTGSQSDSRPSPLPQFTDAQLQNLNNPVFIKFLMSQRQSDLSSVGGYSNVETGSQPDDVLSQKGSTISAVSEPVVVSTNSSAPLDSGMMERSGTSGPQFFSHSIDILSGSTDTMCSEQSSSRKDRDAGSMITAGKSEKSRSNASQGASTGVNSFSIFNTPLQKTGFVTLDELMKGDSDVSRLLNKPADGPTTLSKQSSKDSQSKTTIDSLIVAGERERRNSSFSIGSDDLLLSGSDLENKKVAMKFMGTIPEGVNYNTFLRQISSENSNKSMKFAVLSSPDAISQLKKVSDGGLESLGAGLTGTNQLSAADSLRNSDRCTNSTSTLTADFNDMETQSVRSTYSLGEQIKHMCEGHTESSPKGNVRTPRSESESGEKTLEEAEVTKQAPNNDYDTQIKSCVVKLERMSPERLSLLETGSRKKLKSKKQRDQMSKRKQKEILIPHSDSDVEEEKSVRSALEKATRSEEELVQSGSEEARTPRVPEQSVVKKSLLDEVQLETETQSEAEDKSKSTDARTPAEIQRLKVPAQKLEMIRENVKSKLGAGSGVTTTEYQGPSLSVAVIQEFMGDLYVCYNGSEIRRFDLKTGRILKELDCSPYLVQCLHVTRVEDREDILYTGGACKKLMLFKPEKFNLIGTFDYEERIVCLHENWGRMFLGLADGSVSVRSLKNDKELNQFTCTTSPIHCLASTSAGMTKMLCLGTGDRMVYVLDAISGLLISMLEGHTQPPLCIQVFGETVLSGAADQTMMVHNVSSGALVKMLRSNRPISHIWTDSQFIYTANCDNLVRCFDSDFKLSQVYYGAGKGIITYGLVHNGQLITGNRDGLVEGISQSQLNGRWCCKFGQCALEFTLYDHIRHHVLMEHGQEPACSYPGCKLTFKTSDSRQDHLLSHIR